MISLSLTHGVTLPLLSRVMIVAVFSLFFPLFSGNDSGALAALVICDLYDHLSLPSALILNGNEYGSGNTDLMRLFAVVAV